MQKLALIVALLCGFAIGEFSISRVSDCLNQKLMNRKFKKAKDASLELNYGIIGLEAFNAVSAHQMKQVEFLAQCVQEEDPGFFSLSTEGSPTYYEYGGSNVTTLTGIFQQLLPDVHKELMQTTLKLLKKAEWVEKRKVFGVKRVSYISFEKEGMDEHRAMVQTKLDEIRKAQEMFVIMPHSVTSAKDAERAKQNEEHTQNMLPFVKDHESLYTLIILFDDRPQFAGGEIMVEHRANEQEETEEEYEDEDHDHHHHNSPPKSRSSSEELTSKRTMFFNIETITLEKCSLLLINGKLRHGTELLKHGRRRGLVIDLWQYQDAPISKHTLSLQEGEVLGLIENEDGKREL